MASGNTLMILTPMAGVPTGTSPSFTTIAGASTVAETIPVLAFDDTTQQYIDFYCVMPSNYSAATGITLTIVFSAVETSTDVVSWQAAFRRIEDDTDDLDTTPHTYSFQEVIATAPTIVGEVAYNDITFTAGAQVDSVVAGDHFILRVSRDPTPSSGTDVTGDAYLHMIEMVDT